MPRGTKEEFRGRLAFNGPRETKEAKTEADRSSHGLAAGPLQKRRAPVVNVLRIQRSRGGLLSGFYLFMREM